MSTTPQASSVPSPWVTPVVERNGFLFVSGQLPRRDGTIVAHGAVGVAVDVDQARAAAGISAAACLDVLERHLAGRRFSVAKITGFVVARPGDPVPLGLVVDGASEAILDRLGPERGRHARSAVGVAQLPHEASVEVEMIATIDA
ncbi:RidA family protein [Sciscionella sediminilitoris]|uniref:RidA family protein n=1 Tax=Sciscionella sediminilitoris TaxID=1445613 RepID=UPI0004DF5F93|nr:RidA family protein [Sciscionella sp. SE31]